jgi:poly(3-hydroxybutyrate) depolymerase
MIRLARCLSPPLVFPCASGVTTAERLNYPVDPAQVSAAGISCGAFIADQLHIAHSADIMGAAMIVGGPYGCATLDASRENVEAPASLAS